MVTCFRAGFPKKTTRKKEAEKQKKEGIVRGKSPSENRIYI